MLGDYVEATNDTSILARALPLAEKELVWWATNRTSTIRSPFTNQTYSMARYSVTNSAPRPESYLQGEPHAMPVDGPDGFCHQTTPLRMIPLWKHP